MTDKSQVIEDLKADVASLRAALAPLDEQLAALQVEKDQAYAKVFEYKDLMREVHNQRAPICKEINSILAAIEALEDREATKLAGRV